MQRSTGPRSVIVSAAFTGLLLLLAPLAGHAEDDGFTVEPRQVEDRKAVFATVESIDRSLARSRIQGTVERLEVDEGSQVAAGELIARVEDPKLRLEAAALDSRIESARAEVKLARIELDRMSTLRSKGTVSQSVLDSAETSLSIATGKLAALEAERELVAERQAEGDVLAPADGRILQVEVTEGQVVLPGETIAVLAAESYILRLQLPERHARFMQAGDSVLVGARGLQVGDGGLREGRVRQVYPELERGRVIADVDVTGLGDYFVGERTRVLVATGSRRTFVVPAAYVYRRSGVAYVRVEDVGEVVVQPGRRTAEGLEVLAGLKAGDVLLPPPAPEADGPEP